MIRIKNSKRITSNFKRWMQITVAALLTTAAAQAVTHPSMIIDTNDLPRIICANGRYLQYMRFDGSAWTVENVTEVAVGRSVRFPSLAIDTQERPHISYCDLKDANDADLVYTYFDGSVWNNAVVEDSYNKSYGTYGTSITIDNGGSPHIAYHHHRGGYDGKHAYRVSGIWNKEVFDSNGSYYTSAAFDNSGKICISYFQDNSADLLYRTRNTNGSWTSQTVDTSPSLVFGSTKLIFDPVTGYPRIGYYSSDLLEMRYASYNGATWSVSTVASSLPSTYGNYGLTAVALASDGTPHFAYTDITSNALIHAVHNGISWQKECISMESGAYCAIDLTSDDTPIICHYNNIKGSLEVLWLQGENWVSSYPQTLIMSRETADQDHNGKLDRIKITVNKDLNDNFSGLVTTIDERTITGFTSGESNDGIFYILFDENGAYDTGDIPALQITTNSSLNAGGELLSIDAAPVLPTDAAPPVITSCAVTSTTFTCKASEVITRLSRRSNLVEGEWERVLPDPSGSIAKDTNAVFRAFFYKVSE